MASRYLATVRRATGTPEAFKQVGELASESGLRGFRFLKAADHRRMAMLEVSRHPRC